jgi:hypothetical protein
LWENSLSKLLWKEGDELLGEVMVFAQELEYLHQGLLIVLVYLLLECSALFFE